MGGSSKKPVRAVRYFLGLVLVALRQHDAVLEIQMNKKTVWRGRVKNDQIDVNAENAFGGDEREGGFSGKIDVQSGSNDQAVNPYLSSAKSTLTSGLRGCVSFVYRHCYFGSNTARLPSIRSKHVNIKGIARGWQPLKASIDPELDIEDVAFYCTLEANNKSRPDTYSRARNGLAEFIRSLKDNGKSNSFYIKVRRPSASGGTVSQAFYDISTPAEYEAAADFVAAIGKSSTNLTVSPVDLSDAVGFFNTHNGGGSSLSFSKPLLADDPAAKPVRNIIFSAVSSGISSTTYDSVVAATGATVALVATRNVTGSSSINSLVPQAGQVDVETAADIFQVDSSPEQTTLEAYAGVRATITKSLIVWEDCNPSHLIRCLWTDPMRGGVVDESEIDEESFAAFADLCIEEGMGLSHKFRGIDEVNADRIDVERHVDAVSFRSNLNGKIKIVPVRDNFNIEDLVVLDSNIVTDWSMLSRPRFSEIPNQLTVTYTRRDGEQGSVTRTNISGVQRAGRIIKAETVNYPSCTSEQLAIRLCLRDLRTVTTDLLAGNLPLKYLPSNVEVGTPVLINEPLLGYDFIVMLVSETRIGKHDDSSATITVSEHRYGTTQQITLEKEDPDNNQDAVAPIFRLVEEASYFQGVLNIGQTEIDAELEGEPDLGRFFATGAKANGNQLDATLATSSDGSIWDANGLVDFEPYGVLVNDLSAEADVTTFLVVFNNTQSEILPDQLAAIGDEIIRIDNMVDQGDGTVLVTAGRGCLDGPPRAHSSGDAFVIFSEIEPLEEDYIAGQSVQVKMLSRTGQDAQTLDAAATDIVTFASRANRPYPVGKLQSDGAYAIAEGATGGALTWAHRDRTLQSTPSVDDHTSPNIGPEAGVSYVPFRRVYDDTGAFIETEFASVGQALTFDFTTDQTEYDDTTELVGIGVRVKRGSVENFRDAELLFRPALPPVLTATSVEDDPA